MGKTTEKITDAMKIQLITLYNEGKMDSEIAKIVGIKRATICYFRKKQGLITKFTYSKISKI
jgi:transposase-like protein